MFSFRLSEAFLSEYKDRPVAWGLTDAGGNSVGELTLIRTYSRVKDDGKKERWWEVCERVINGMYSIQKDHCKRNRLEWNGQKAQQSAQEAFDRLFNLKWTPPGRGLFAMGTPLVMSGDGSPLQNCGMVSTGDMTRHNPGEPFGWTTEAMMVGVGIGFDTLGRGKFDVNEPNGEPEPYQIPDTRQGWADSITKLVNSYLKADSRPVKFDYSLIRPYGSPIKTFGGTASGPEPLEKGHGQIEEVLRGNAGEKLTSKTIVDIMNIIGTFVVAGNTRRSAELALGEADDDVFPDLKNWEKHPEREWRWMSNNSISAKVGMDYSKYIPNTVANGEPGFIWLDVARNYGRLVDPPDYKDLKVKGFNPCAEQPLESFEMCTLAELHINRSENLEDFQRSAKFSYLYAKTVTLLNTPWEKTNAVMMRNRRIGLSMTGIANFIDRHSLHEWRTTADATYRAVKAWDTVYSDWLGVRESIRSTTLKPSGSVSLLSGASPGVHWTPGGEYYLRAVRFGAHDIALDAFREAGYTVEKAVASDNTYVVYFPIHTDALRSEKDVSIFEKVHLAAEVQKYWSDNGVSVTVSFDTETESKHVETVVNMYEGQLKAVSFLPMGNEVYEQQPYTQLTKEEYESYIGRLKKINTDALYNNGVDAIGESYCTTDVCEVKEVAPAETKRFAVKVAADPQIAEEEDK